MTDHKFTLSGDLVLGKDGVIRYYWRDKRYSDYRSKDCPADAGDLFYTNPEFVLAVIPDDVL